MESSGARLFAGSCFCKAVSLEISALPRSSYLCHCQDCRRFTGTSFAHNIVFPVSSVSLLVSGVNYSIIDNTVTTTTQPESNVANDTIPQAEDESAATADPEALRTFGNPKDGMIKFCGTCAGRLLITCAADNTSMSGFIIVPVGVIDDSESDGRLAPKAEFWCKRQESWMPCMRDTKMYATMT